MRRDARVKVAFRNSNGHISAASNSALELATGEFMALLDHDDELPPHALYMVAVEMNRHPDADIIYSDEDKIDEQGRRFQALFKPDWNPDLFFSQNYISHLGVYRTSLVNRIGGFRTGYEGSQDYDLCLRCVAKTDASRIRHIPFILYHWRAIAGSTAVSTHQKSYAEQAAVRALSDYFQTIDPAISVKPGKWHTTYVVTYPLPKPPPLVSLIIPTRDGYPVLKRCVESILRKTDYPNYELIIVDNQSTQTETLDYLKSLERQGIARVLRYDAPFNYSAINNFAVREARGEVVGLLNNDLEVISKGWLAEMVRHAIRPEIGAVGAKLYYPNGRIQHAGVVVGIGAAAGHVHHGYFRDQPGYWGRLILTHELSAVTAACLVVRKALYEQVGGLDEEHLAIAYNDIDFCLKLREEGYRNIWTPFAELRHHESWSRGYEDTSEKRDRFNAELSQLQTRWGSRLLVDPHYNPNLTLHYLDFTLAWPPRVTKPWLAAERA
jgi:GT2 family glycosyltransferase